MVKCITCGREINTIPDNVIFECIDCGKQIVRCGNCRKSGLAYKCSCGFEGF